MLCNRFKGLLNRSKENCSIGPISINDLVVFLVGSMIIEVESLYNCMGEVRETALWIFACFITASEFSREV